MKPASILYAALLLVLACAVAGCSSGPGTGPATTVQQPTTLPATPSPTPAGAAISLTPGPTQTLPPQYFVDVQVQKQEQSGVPTITVTFRGGTGMDFINQVNIVVTRSDGVIKTATMMSPRVGEERDIEGTSGDDRVEVTALVTTGSSYKIIDEVLPFQSINP